MNTFLNHLYVNLGANTTESEPYGDMETDRRKEAFRDEDWLSWVSRAGI